MHLVRYVADDGTAPCVGVRDDDRGLCALPYASMATALRLPLSGLRAACSAANTPVPGEVRLLPPIDGRTEVWAAGVTYSRSREARTQESDIADVYARVYEAERPELFLKSVAWRVVTDGDPIGIRADSGLDVPEPELALVANAAGEVVGYTVCNDVGSRSIEGENPLYLPQAKVYAGACAPAPGIRPVWELPDATDLAISCRVLRDGAVAWSGRTSTADMRRRPDELLSWLYRQDYYPDGAVLSTGTGLVPDLDITLHEGDRVDIEIGGVGGLRNEVALGIAPFAWLAQRDALPGPTGASA